MPHACILHAHDACADTRPPCCRYYLELNTKQRKEWEQRLEELKKASEEEVRRSMGCTNGSILCTHTCAHSHRTPLTDHARRWTTGWMRP